MSLLIELGQFFSEYTQAIEKEHGCLQALHGLLLDRIAPGTASVDPASLTVALREAAYAELTGCFCNLFPDGQVTLPCA